MRLSRSDRRRAPTRPRGRLPRPGIEALERREVLTSGLALTGVAYLDLDANGHRGPNDRPLAGAEVLLTTDDGLQVLGRATTGADGSYQFDDGHNVDSGDLGARTYRLELIPPAGVVGVGVELPAAGMAWPGEVPASAYATVNADAGVSTATVDFVASPAATLAGAVYQDLNANGLRDAADAPVAGELVQVSGADLWGNSVTTFALAGPDGAYKFEALAPGTYALLNGRTSGLIAGAAARGRVTSASGATATNVGTVRGADAIDGIALNAGAAGSGFDFGQVHNAISGRVVRDVTGDGFDPGDTPLGGVQVKLYRDANGNGVLDAADGNPIATTTSDPITGAYRFLSPAEGFYFVKETVPSGYVRITPIESDSSYVHVCGCGIEHGGVDFANFKKPTTGDVTNFTYTITGAAGTRCVTDLRGKVDPGDVVTMTFTVKPGKTAEVNLVSYTAPAASFSYDNADLQQVFYTDGGTFGAGTHTLRVVVPNSYFQVDAVLGAVIQRFGPAESNIFYGRQSRLLSADNDGKKAAGVSSLAGTVFDDRNGNGRQDAGESGIAGVVVVAYGLDYQGNWVSRTATTDVKGNYLFNGLTASDRDGYTLEVAPDQAVLDAYLDDLAKAGSVGGCVDDGLIADIFLNVNTKATGYTFGMIRRR